jgi:hypothetical protein
LTVKDTPDLLPADTFFFVETGKLANGCHNTLTGAFGSPGRLDERPIVIVQNANLFAVPAEIHAETLSEISTAVARPFSALHRVFRELRFEITWLY